MRFCFRMQVVAAVLLVALGCGTEGKTLQVSVPENTKTVLQLELGPNDEIPAQFVAYRGDAVIQSSLVADQVNLLFVYYAETFEELGLTEGTQSATIGDACGSRPLPPSLGGQTVSDLTEGRLKDADSLPASLADLRVSFPSAFEVAAPVIIEVEGSNKSRPMLTQGRELYLQVDGVMLELDLDRAEAGFGASTTPPIPLVGSQEIRGHYVHPSGTMIVATADAFYCGLLAQGLTRVAIDTTLFGVVELMAGPEEVGAGLEVMFATQSTEGLAGKIGRLSSAAANCTLDFEIIVDSELIGSRHAAQVTYMREGSAFLIPELGEPVIRRANGSLAANLEMQTEVRASVLMSDGDVFLVGRRNELIVMMIERLTSDGTGVAYRVTESGTITPRKAIDTKRGTLAAFGLDGAYLELYPSEYEPAAPVTCRHLTVGFAGKLTDVIRGENEVIITSHQPEPGAPQDTSVGIVPLRDPWVRIRVTPLFGAP